MEDSKIVYDFYENDYNEDIRLERHEIEFIRTKEIISRYLTNKKIKIADLCGATGIYSYWLASLQHEVHLLDLSNKHIEQAKGYEEKYNLKLASFTCCDARNIPYKNEEFDMVLLMGALYHLQNQEDRIKCIKEAYRVLKPNGIAIFSFISKYASMIDGLRYSLVDDPEFVTILDEDLNSGNHNNLNKRKNYFTTAFFHTPDLIKKELKLGFFNNISLFSVEGISSAIDSKVGIDVMLKYVRLTESIPELMGISSHILAVSKKLI